MGRGLSPLQRWMLREAAARPRLYYADVLSGYFGWKPARRIDRHAKDEVVSALGATVEHKAGEISNRGAQHFSRKGIGERTYRKVMATLSRSAKRLGERGLVTCLVATNSHWSAVEITDKGRERLSVNLEANCHRVNR